MTTGTQHTASPPPGSVERDVAGTGRKATEGFKVEGTESVAEITAAIRNTLHSVFCASIDLSTSLFRVEDISSRLVIAEGFHASFQAAKAVVGMSKAPLEMAHTTTDEAARAQLKRRIATEWAAAAVEQYRTSAEAWLKTMNQQMKRLDESGVPNNRVHAAGLEEVCSRTAVMLNAAQERLLRTCDGEAR